MLTAGFCTNGSARPQRGHTVSRFEINSAHQWQGRVVRLATIRMQKASVSNAASKPHIKMLIHDNSLCNWSCSASVRLLMCSCARAANVKAAAQHNAYRNRFAF